MVLRKGLKMKREEKRAAQRFPYRYPASYVALGHTAHPPDKEAASGEIMDLSDKGMRMRVKGRKLVEGAVLLVKVSLSSAPVTVPSLVQVQWIKEEKPGTYETGLKFVVQ
jgi:hypothetical protein